MHGIVLPAMLAAAMVAATNDTARTSSELLRPTGRQTAVRTSRNTASVTTLDSSAPRLRNVRELAEQNKRSRADWGRVLTDIVRRLPADSRYDEAYRRYIEAGDLVTAGHEWTHFLNEYLTLQSGVGTSSYYLLEGRYVSLADPEGLRGIVPSVPASLRGELHELYLVRNGSNAKIDPLYLLDEWVAYTNDLAVAVDQLASGKPLNEPHCKVIQSMTAGNVLEFTFYGFALGMAVQQYDPAYYNSSRGHALREFIAWNASRALELYQQAIERDELVRGDARHTRLMRSFRTGSDTAAMRAWVRRELGTAVADGWIGPDATRLSQADVDGAPIRQ